MLESDGLETEWMGSKDSNLEQELQRLPSCQLLHFPTSLEQVTLTMVLPTKESNLSRLERCSARVLHRDWG